MGLTTPTGTLTDAELNLIRAGVFTDNYATAKVSDYIVHCPPWWERALCRAGFAAGQAHPQGQGEPQLPDRPPPQPCCGKWDTCERWCLPLIQHWRGPNIATASKQPAHSDAELLRLIDEAADDYGKARDKDNNPDECAMRDCGYNNGPLHSRAAARLRTLLDENARLVEANARAWVQGYDAKAAAVTNADYSWKPRAVEAESRLAELQRQHEADAARIDGLRKDLKDTRELVMLALDARAQAVAHVANLVGLFQLLKHRDDMPDDLLLAYRNNHRLRDAETFLASAKADERSDGQGAAHDK